MIDNVRANHVQIDIGNAARKVIARLHSSRVITIFPESPAPTLSMIVFLSSTAADELHGLSDLAFAAILDKQMYVITGDYIIEDAQAISTLCNV